MSVVCNHRPGGHVCHSSPSARASSVKLIESSCDKSPRPPPAPSSAANELRLTIKCVKIEKKKQNVSFIRRSMAATLLTHSRRSAEGLGFRLPRYQSRDGRTSRSIKWAAWGKREEDKTSHSWKNETREREIESGRARESAGFSVWDQRARESRSEWSRTGSGSAPSPPPPFEGRRFIISGICFRLESILSFREHPSNLVIFFRVQSLNI